MTIPLMQVSGLTYVYDNDKIALNNVGFTIYHGERIAVIGSNGAGKSTLFLNLNGVLIPDSGEIIFKGKKLTSKKKDLNELRKGVGIVFQDADNQIIASTVKGEISFGPMNLKLTRAEVKDRVNKAIQYMNLESFQNRPPHYLSGGEKKRVTIADILAMESDIIIFDEPMASLDPINSSMLEELLGRLSANGKTLVIAAHDMDFVYRFAERILVFAEGHMIADNTPERIFADQDILDKANLKKPMIVQMCEILETKGILKNGCRPRTVEELKKCIL